MEEKERYEWDKIEESYEWIRDTETVNQPLYYDLKTVAHILNQQDRRIKELELLLNADKKIKTNSIKGFEKLKQENLRLKQSQKQLAIEELEKTRQLIVSNDEHDEEVGCNIIKTFDLLEDISDRIKNLKEKNNGRII